MMMIVWLLTLLAAPLAHGFDHAIDLTRCQTDTICFIRQSCFNGADSDAHDMLAFHEMIKYEPTIRDDCNGVIQIKTLNQLKFHVMMQVKLSDTEKLKIGTGLKLFHQEDVFVCKPEGITGSFDYKIVPMGKQIFEGQHIFCSFSAEILDKRKQSIVELYKYKNVIYSPRLIYTKDDGFYKTSYWRSTETIWSKIHNATCDSDLLRSSTKDSKSDASIVLTEVDTTRDSMRCTSDFIIVKNSDGVEIKTTSIACDEGNKWSYEVDGKKEHINEEFEVFCAIKRCELCPTPPPHLRSPGCSVTTYTPTGAHGNTCPTLTCTNGKFTADGQSTLEGVAECKKSKVDPSKYSWFAGGIELEQASCLVNAKPTSKRDAEFGGLKTFLGRAN